MNKHYKEALIEATAEHLQENCGEENVNRDLLNEILEDDYWDTEDAECSFREDLDCLTDQYLQRVDEEDEEVVSPEEEVEETLSKLHVGANFIPGIGLGYCHSEEDLESMKAWLRDRMLAAKYLERIFGDPDEE